MKNFYRLASISFLALTLLTPGCGGGGGGGGDSSQAGAASAGGMAPSSATGRNLRLIDSTGAPQTVAFAAQDNTFTQFENGTGAVTRSGTFVYSPSGNTATVSLTDSTSHEVVTLHLNFETASSGTFSFSSSTGTVGSGRFENFTSDTSGNVTPPPGSGGQTGGTNNGQPSTGGTGTDTGSGGLDGRMMTLTRSTGQTHSYSFSGSRFTDSDPPEMGTGTYSFTRNGSQATLILQYTGSSPAVDLRGDRHEVQMTLNTETQGTYTGTYTIHDGTVLPQTGTFNFIQ